MISNPTVGFDGCLGLTAQFSVAQTPFFNSQIQLISATRSDKDGELLH